MTISREFSFGWSRILPAVLTFTALTLSNSLQADTFDPEDDVPSGATRLNPGSSVQSVEPPRNLLLIPPGGVIPDYIDYFKLNLDAGVTYNFNSVDGRSTGDPTIRIIDIDSLTVLAADDDSGVGLQFSLDFTPATSGEFYLVVEPYSYSSAPFNYILNFSEGSGDGGTGGGGGGGGIGGGGGGTTGPITNITGTPVEVTDLPLLTVVSQLSNGSAATISGTAVGGLPSTGETVVVSEETEASKPEAVPVASVVFRYRHNSQPWSEWSSASGTDSWIFETSLPTSGFMMFQAKAIGSDGKEGMVKVGVVRP